MFVALSPPGAGEGDRDEGFCGRPSEIDKWLSSEVCDDRLTGTSTERDLAEETAVWAAKAVLVHVAADVDDSGGPFLLWNDSDPISLSRMSYRI